MNTIDAKPAPPRHRGAVWLIFLLLATIPSGYLYLTGRQDRSALQRENDELLQRTAALADSLDGARTQLLLDAALASLWTGNYEGARALTSDFFERVDQRSRRPGAEAGETESRLALLALRDQAITELSRQTPEGARILEELATLHLALADPELKARTPLTTFRAGPPDTLLRTPMGLPGDTTGPDTVSGPGGGS